MMFPGLEPTSVAGVEGGGSELSLGTTAEVLGLSGGCCGGSLFGSSGSCRDIWFGVLVSDLENLLRRNLRFRIHSNINIIIIY